MARAASGQAGTTRGEAPAIEAAIRPRLNATASSRPSFAASSAVTRKAFGSNRAGNVREAELVHKYSVGAAAVWMREIDTRRVALVQWNTSRCVPVASTKAASLPPGMVLYDQEPDATWAVAKSGAAGAAVAAWTASAMSDAVVIIIE